MAACVRNELLRVCPTKVASTRSDRRVIEESVRSNVMTWLWICHLAIQARDGFPLLRFKIPLHNGVDVRLATYPARRCCRTNANFQIPSRTDLERCHPSAPFSPPTTRLRECDQDNIEIAGDSGPSAAAVGRARASVLEIGQLLLRSHPVKKGRESFPEGVGAQIRNVVSEDFSSCSTQVRFDEYDLSPLSIKVLHTVLGYERMMPVQAATLSLILQGKDILAKAKTGSGKTIAFLLPAIEVVLEGCLGTWDIGRGIYCVIVCPTRELALQISCQARVLLQFHSGIGVQVLTGGFRVSKERKALQSSHSQIVVATPGRLLDHVEKTEGFKERLGKLKILIFDEADHVLDMGYRKSVEDIIQCIPPFRQTLLFSATVPREVFSIAKVALKEDYVFIDTVGTGGLDTQAQVKQKYIVAPVQKHLAVLYSILEKHIKDEPNYKVLVFCITARITEFMFQLFEDLGFKCSEIHSKKSQMYRFHAYNEFRNSEGSTILFSSDVSARGVDYPNITLVIQVGVPDHSGKYIHRLGRTGRVGKDGEAILMLTPWEEKFLEKIIVQPIERDSDSEIDPAVGTKIVSSLLCIDSTIRMHAYRTWIGYYQSLKGFGINKETIVKYANEYSLSIGFDIPPALPKSVIKKMALHGVPGLRRQRHFPR